MDLTQEFPIRRHRAEHSTAERDTVVTEVRIELDVNDGQARIALLCTPSDLEALAVGLLMGEGALRRRQDLQQVEARPGEAKVVVRGDFDADALEALVLRWTRTSGCGGAATGRDVDAPAHATLPPGPVVSPARLLELAEAFHRRATGSSGDEVAPSGPPAGLWRRTGGVHAAALADGKELLLYAEDVGRHNAVDKVVGTALLRGIDLRDKLLITTGRLSAEMAAKAVACGVPILLSRSAVTSLAVQIARRFNLTLIGFARGGRLNVYAGFDRVRPPAACEPPGA
jgi:FdhD protein